LTLTGAAPALLNGQVRIPPSGALSVVGVAPILNRITPPRDQLQIVGQIPGVSKSTKLTVPTGSLSLVGSAPVLKNPNWVNIDDSQTANWVAVAA
jgi:hypothetical protein